MDCLVVLGWNMFLFFWAYTYIALRYTRMGKFYWKEPIRNERFFLVLILRRNLECANMVFPVVFSLVGAKLRTLTWWQRGQGSSCTQRCSTLPMSERYRASNDISRPVKRFTPWVTMRLWCRRLELHVILEAKTPADTRWVCKCLWLSKER